MERNKGAKGKGIVALNGWLWNMEQNMLKVVYILEWIRSYITQNDIFLKEFEIVRLKLYYMIIIVYIIIY